MSNAAKTFVLFAITLLTAGMQAIELPIETRPPAPAEPDTSGLDGAQLFTTHCAMCHQRAALARRLQTPAGPEGAKAKMASFLAHHSRSDAATDAAIIDYLATPSPAP